VVFKFGELLAGQRSFSFTDSSRGGIVVRHVQCAQSTMDACCWICRSVWQQSIALFNELCE